MPPPRDGTRGDMGERWRGAVAGVVPVLAIALLFAASGSKPTAALIGLGLGLAMTAGWLAGPLAGRSHRAVAGAIGYALTLLAMNAGVSVIQAGWDAWLAHGIDPLAIAGAGTERALYALVSAAYLITPAVLLGFGWVAAARGMAFASGSRR